MLGKRPGFWDRKCAISIALWPLSALFGGVVAARRVAYRAGLFKSYRSPVPVIVVGNISVGGTGKTPLVLWVVGLLKSRGWRPGVVSRGHGGRSITWPRTVNADSDPREVGDEPVLVAQKADCPVAAGPDRRKACELLLRAGCDIVISDDGLQHYALERDLEIMVRDGVSGWGNGMLIPAGPLREPVGRWREADFAVSNGGTATDGSVLMDLELGDAFDVATSETRRPLSSFAGSLVHAVAGIGDPQRFFRSLREAGLEPCCHPFPDHHGFLPRDLELTPPAPILMTEKDAVKCSAWFPEDCWYVPVEAKLSDGFDTRLADAVDRIGAAQSER